MLHKGTGIPLNISMKKKIVKAINLIQEWLKLCDYKVYCSISGGKDSLVAADLITQVYPNCPLVWVNQGELAEWEDCIDLIEYYRECGYNVIELCPPRSLLKLYYDFGIPLEGKMSTSIDKKINSRLVYYPIDEWREANGITGKSWGIRKEESKNRRLFLCKHGELHKNKRDEWICTPIGFWTTVEIWQYIDANQLLYPAMYDIDRLTIRNGPPIGTTGINYGRIVNLKKHFPDKYQLLVKHFPEISKYS